jgi:hypothetical protein
LSTWEWIGTIAAIVAIPGLAIVVLIFVKPH